MRCSLWCNYLTSAFSILRLCPSPVRESCSPRAQPLTRVASGFASAYFPTCLPVGILMKRHGESQSQSRSASLLASILMAVLAALSKKPHKPHAQHSEISSKERTSPRITTYFIFFGGWGFHYRPATYFFPSAPPGGRGFRYRPGSAVPPPPTYRPRNALLRV
jgi:hypothetical protein